MFHNGDDEATHSDGRKEGRKAQGAREGGKGRSMWWMSFQRRMPTIRHIFECACHFSNKVDSVSLPP